MNNRKVIKDEPKMRKAWLATRNLVSETEVTAEDPTVREYWKKNIGEFKPQVKWFKSPSFYKSLAYIGGGVLALIPGTQSIGVGVLGVLGVFDGTRKGVKLRESGNPKTLADKPILKIIFDAIIKIIKLLTKK